MKLLSVELENFKYHKKISLNCNGKNILVFGENGAGKTSIFRAMFSLLYYYRENKVRNSGFRDQHINKNSLSEELKVKIDFNNSQKIERVDSKVSGEGLVKDSNFFMLESRDLDELLDGRFNTQITKHFGNEYDVEVIYRDLLTSFERGKESSQSESDFQKELRDLRAKLDKN